MIDDTLLDAEERMDKALSVAREDLASVRTGRAAPSMFNKIVVDYYGAPTPVPQMASITVPEARMAVIKPYDSSQLAAIERAIRDSDLGVNPTNDGQVLRVVFPQLTEERRRDLVKMARPRARTPRSPSATSAAGPRRSSTASPRTARPARTRCARRRTWTTSPPSTPTASTTR